MIDKDEVLISIIVPVYNVQDYLQTCISSLMNQTYENIEIILVDDGSKDCGGELCDKFALLDSRIRAFHKENGGLSEARNFGVEMSSGKYITFVDSDDYVSCDYIRCLYNMVICKNADIACCNFTEVHDQNQVFDNYKHESYHIYCTGKDACKLMLNSKYTLQLVVAWGKLYKAELVREHSFPVGRKHEDEATTFKFFYYSTSIVISDICLYAYYQRPNSITREIGKCINYDAIWARNYRAVFFEEHGESELAKLAWSRLAGYLINDSINNTRTYGFIGQFVDCSKVNFRTLLKLKVYKFSPRLYIMLLNVRRRVFKMGR